jgi:hypothetical protein
VDPLDRHLVNGRFGFREPLEHRLRSIAPRVAQRGLVDEREDLGEIAMKVLVVVTVMVAMIILVAVAVRMSMMMAVRCRVPGN